MAPAELMEVRTSPTSVPESETGQTFGVLGFSSPSMTTREQSQDLDIDALAQIALDEARAMPPGPEKSAALRKAGELRNAADIRGFIFARRGRPPKA